MNKSDKWIYGKVITIARPATQEGVESACKELKQVLSELTLEEHRHTYITQSMNDNSVLIIIHCPPFKEGLK